MTIATATRHFLRNAASKIELPDNIRTLTGFQPNALQEELLAIKARMQVHYVHRRAGKSYGYIGGMFERLVECPFEDPVGLFTAGSMDQARKIAWKQMVRTATRLGGRQLKREEAVYFPARNGTEACVYIQGSDSVGDSVRGGYLDYVINDEHAFDGPSYWRTMIRPMLADQTRRGFDRHGYPNQTSIRISTMNGRNHMWRAYKDACAWQEGRPVIQRDKKTGREREITKRPGTWAAMFRPVTDTDLIDADELEELEGDLTPAEFAREFMLDPDAMAEGAIYADELARLRKHGLIGQCPYNKNYPVNACCDIGWNDKALWYFQIIGPSVNWLGYSHYRRKRWNRVVSDMRSKGWKWGVTIIPEDSKFHNSDGQQTLSTLKGLGLNVVGAPRVPKQQACELIVPKILLRSRFDETYCDEGLDALALYKVEYDEDADVWGDTTSKGWVKHPSDAMRYGAVWIDKQMNG